MPLKYAQAFMWMPFPKSSNFDYTRMPYEERYRKIQRTTVRMAIALITLMMVMAEIGMRHLPIPNINYTAVRHRGGFDRN